MDRLHTRRAIKTLEATQKEFPDERMSPPSGGI
jgi:hypothetical protein